MIQPSGRVAPSRQGMFRGSPWQRLYLRPDPHGHGSLRPTRLYSSPPAAVRLVSTCVPPSTDGAEYSSRCARRGARPAGIAGAWSAAGVAGADLAPADLAGADLAGADLAGVAPVRPPGRGPGTPGPGVAGVLGASGGGSAGAPGRRGPAAAV